MSIDCQYGCRALNAAGKFCLGFFREGSIASAEVVVSSLKTAYKIPNKYFQAIRPENIYLEFYY